MPDQTKPILRDLHKVMSRPSRIARHPVFLDDETSGRNPGSCRGGPPTPREPVADREGTPWIRAVRKVHTGRPSEEASQS